MTSDIQAFFDTINATFEGAHCYFVSDKQQPELPTNFVSPLSHYGLLAVSGPEANKFLQGQTTCNLQEVNETHSRPGAYCSAKGRIVTNFHVALADNELYLLRMRQSLIASTAQILSKYIVFSKAEQKDTCKDYILFGLYGDKAQTAIEKAFSHIPQGVNTCVSHQGNVAIQRDEKGLIFECWIKLADMSNYWPTLSKELELVGSQFWELLMIRQGAGEIQTNTTNLFIPQMLNYQATGAISFNKGCYTGQEVVARMQYRGKLKRRMYRTRFESHAPLTPGQEICREEKGQSIGNLVNITAIGINQYEALAVMVNDYIEEKAIYINGNRTKMEILSLPYTISNDK